MTVIPKKTLLLPALTLALAAVAAPAQAGQHPPKSPNGVVAHFFAATLTGANEIAPAGDPDGSGKAEVEVAGDLVTFALSWKNIPAPTMGHIHTGAAGVNGPVSVPFFTTPMPDTTVAAGGVVQVTDAILASAIVADPAGFYVNLHTTEFPAGAVRGQLAPSRPDKDPLHLLKGLPLQTLMDGAHEVATPGGPAVGDPDGQGIGMIRASGKKVNYTFAWGGIGQPIMGHIHVGAKGVAGPVVVPLFMSPIPEHIFAITGTVRGLDKSLVRSIRYSPGSYYVNLHTAAYPGGALRNQLFHRPAPALD